MKKTGTAFMLVIFLFVGLNSVFAEDELIDKLDLAEKLFQAWDHPENLVEAAGIFDELVIQYPDNYDVLWLAARCYEKLGKQLDEPLAVYEKGKDLAEKATELYPDKVEAHYWLSALLGRVGEEKGILNSLFMVKPMKAELERCIEIDPSFPDSYYVLGMLYWKVPGWPLSIGDKKKAVEYATKAVELNPDSFAFRWGLYEAYDAAKKDKEAKEVLEWIVQMPVKPGYELDAADYKQRAGEKL